MTNFSIDRSGLGGIFCFLDCSWAKRKTKMDSVALANWNQLWWLLGDSDRLGQRDDGQLEEAMVAPRKLRPNWTWLARGCPENGCERRISTKNSPRSRKNWQGLSRLWNPRPQLGVTFATIITRVTSASLCLLEWGDSEPQWSGEWGTYDN